MTTAQAINKAIQVFNKAKKGGVRTVALMEGTGPIRDDKGRETWKQIVIRIGYAIDGDYTESDANPFEVNVYEADGKICAERVGEEKGEDWDRFNTLAKICSRAEKLGIRQGTRMTAMLDVDLADKRWHLRLHEWLASDDFNFIHDFVGIQNHVDRINKTFDNRFLPRFAGKTE